MKFTYQLVLQTTAPRTENYVKFKSTTNDYFLGVNITEVDGKPITGLPSLFDAMKDHFPSLKFNEVELNSLFGVAIQPNSDVVAIPVMYYADFREDRNNAKDIDLKVVEKAQKYVEHPVEGTFEVDDSNFQLLANSLLAHKIQTEAKKTAGLELRGRDALLSLILPDSLQVELKAVLETILGAGQKLKDASGTREIDTFSLTVAQSTQFSKTLGDLETKGALQSDEPQNTQQFSL